jgi:hypothetical protein
VVTEILKMAELVDQHRVPEMEIGGGGIEAGLDPQGTAAFQLLDQLGFNQQLFGPTLDQREVVFNSAHANLYGFCPESFWREGFFARLQRFCRRQSMKESRILTHSHPTNDRPRRHRWAAAAIGGVSLLGMVAAFAIAPPAKDSGVELTQLSRNCRRQASPCWKLANRYFCAKSVSAAATPSPA